MSRDPTEVIVTLSEAYLDQLSAVARNLEEHGLAVQSVLEVTGQITGQITGSVPAAVQLAALRGLPGVEDVVRSGTVQLPPPESDLL